MFKGGGVQNTERDFADKEWLSREPLPLPVLLMDIGLALLGASGLVVLCFVVLALQ